MSSSSNNDIIETVPFKMDIVDDWLDSGEIIVGIDETTSMVGTSIHPHDTVFQKKLQGRDRYREGIITNNSVYLKKADVVGIADLTGFNAHEPYAGPSYGNFIVGSFLSGNYRIAIIQRLRSGIKKTERIKKGRGSSKRRKQIADTYLKNGSAVVISEIKADNRRRRMLPCGMYYSKVAGQGMSFNYAGRHSRGNFGYVDWVPRFDTNSSKCCWTVQLSNKSTIRQMYFFGGTRSKLKNTVPPTSPVFDPHKYDWVESKYDLSNELYRMSVVNIGEVFWQQIVINQTDQDGLSCDLARFKAPMVYYAGHLVVVFGWRYKKTKRLQKKKKSKFVPPELEQCTNIVVLDIRHTITCKTDLREEKPECSASELKLDDYTLTQMISNPADLTAAVVGDKLIMVKCGGVKKSSPATIFMYDFNSTNITQIEIADPSIDGFDVIQNSFGLYKLCISKYGLICGYIATIDRKSGFEKMMPYFVRLGAEHGIEFDWSPSRHYKYSLLFHRQVKTIMLMQYREHYDDDELCDPTASRIDFYQLPDEVIGRIIVWVARFDVGALVDEILKK